MSLITLGLEVADCGLGDADLEDMRSKAVRFFAREADVAEQIKNELQPGRKLKKEVEYWLGEVGKMKEKKQEIEKKAKGGALSSPIDDLKKEVKQFTAKCMELVQHNLPAELTLFDGAGCNLPLPAETMEGKLFKENKEKILSWLDGDGAISIGIYGMGGVGKTTLATEVQKELCRRFNTGECSGYVYWVTVSHGITVSSLQSKIANQMRLRDQFRADDEKNSAAILYRELKGLRNCVLILDDMWENLSQSLKEIGIPIGEDGFKLLVTARSKEVCRWLGLKETINVKCLTDDESWDLFREKLGNSVILTQEVEDIARMVAKECKGLPIAIVTIASSMRGEDSIREWRNLLKQLQQLTTRQQEVVEQKVLPLLQLSYDRLGKSQLKDCFLCCAFYPEDHNILVEEELIACWTREGLLEGIESREERRDEGHSIVNRLVNACLLEYNNDKDGVKMHDLVREMAVKVCGGKHFLIRAGEGRTDIPPEEEWTVDLCKVSLMRNDIKSISPVEPPSCPNLKTLLLNNNYELKSISSNFFSHLTSLRVLDLSWTGIETLPESISGLVNLTHLLLSNCYYLTDLPSLSKLQKLTKLDLSHTGIKSLPESISDLVNLTHLLLGGCPRLTDLPSLSKLQKLTKLDLRRSGIKRLPGSISDLVNLTHLLLSECKHLTDLPSLSKLQKLRELDLSGTPIESLPESISDLVNLTDLLLGCCRDLTDLPSLSKLQMLTKLDLSRTWIKSLPESISDLVNLTDLLLRGCESLTDLPSLSKLQKLTKLDLFKCRQLNSWPDGMGSLRNLKVLDCIGSGVVVGFSAGSDLEELQLEHSEGGGGGKAKPLDLKMLEHLKVLWAIWKSNTDFNAYVTSERFLRLHRYQFIVGTDYPEEIPEEIMFGYGKFVMFSGCRLDGEKHRIPFDVELLLFYKCVIGEESSLMLREVPQSVVALKKIWISYCKGAEFVLCSASSAISGLLPVEMLRKLETIGLVGLDGFKGLVKAGVLPPPDALSNLRELKVNSCHGLKWLFTPAMAGNLQNLRDLRITGCEALEEVIGGSDNDAVDQPRYLPNLEKLYMEGLPNLKSIRSGGLSNLWKLEIMSCDGLKWLFTPTMACNLQNLLRLYISNCLALEEVIGGSDNDAVDQPRYLPNLKVLCLKDLPNLKRICQVGKNVGCRYVLNCPKLEE